MPGGVDEGVNLWPKASFAPSVPLSSGVIRTALPNMDRETRDQYVLVIQAKDMVGQMGGLSGTTSVTVTLTDVNDNPPRFAHSKIQLLIVPAGTIKLVMSSSCHVLNSSAIRIKPPTPCFTYTFFFVLAEWGFKDLLSLENHLISDKQMRVQLVLCSMNAV